MSSLWKDSKTDQHTDFCHTSDLDKKWRCEHCGKIFLVQRRMEIHTNTHLKRKPYKCRNNCYIWFSDAANRGQHGKRFISYKFNCE